MRRRISILTSENPLQVRLIPPYTREEIPGDCHVIPMPDTWVSDALQGELARWCPTQPVLIAAPTGRGKTEFVKRIAQHQRYRRGSILLLVHRSAIAVQQKRRLAAALHSRWEVVEDLRALDYADEALSDVGVTVMTYQRFAARHAQMRLQEVAWLVCDEVHAFYSDALFSPHMDPLFWQLPKMFRHAHRLYLTATPGPILPLLCRAEQKNLLSCRNCLCSREGRGRLLLYRFPSRFSAVDLHYYRRIDEIAELVLSRPEEKFLIFTAAREKPEAVSQSYKKSLEGRGISVAYLDRFSKGTPAWDAVCREERFAQQALVCTSVLDCGVNLKDPALRHIVVEATDKTEFLQMLGRKRLETGAPVHAYIRVPDSATLRRRLTQVQDDLRFIRQAEKALRGVDNGLLLHRGWNDESEERRYMRLLNCAGGRLSPKPTAVEALRWQEATLQQLLQEGERLGDDSALPRLAHAWLEQPGAYDQRRWLDYDRQARVREELEQFLAEHTAVPMAPEAFSRFSRRLGGLVNAIRTFPHDGQRTLGAAALNNRLAQLELPYKIQKTKDRFEIFCVKEGGRESCLNRLKPYYRRECAP